MFISLICNSSSLSSFSDLLRKKKIILKYMIDEHRGPGEYRTCASSCRHAVLFVFFFLLSEGKSHEKCVLYMRNFQKSASVNFSTSVWTCFAGLQTSHRLWAMSHHLTGTGQCDADTSKWLYLQPVRVWLGLLGLTPHLSAGVCRVTCALALPGLVLLLREK